MNKDYIGIKDVITSIKCEDDWHDLAFNLSQIMEEIGSRFGFGDNVEDSIRNELELRDLLRQKAKLYE